MEILKKKLVIKKFVFFLFCLHLIYKFFKKYFFKIYITWKFLK